MISSFLSRLFGVKEQTTPTSIGPVKDENMQGFVKDGCAFMVDNIIIIDTTLYKDKYWEAMKNSPDPENRDYYKHEYDRSRRYREAWLQTENGVAWKKRHGYHSSAPTVNEVKAK